MGSTPAPPDEAHDLAEVDATVGGPVLVVLPDPERRVPADWLVLGRRSIDRLAQAALEQGFEAVYLAPGTGPAPPRAIEMATGERVGRPALVVFEGSFVDPELLRLMVEHPLEPDERFSVYDEQGRPVGWFTGRLGLIPSVMPVSEELDLPEGLSAADVGRIVDPEDRESVERIVLRAAGVPTSLGSWWFRSVELPLWRLLTRIRRPMPQIELLAVFLGLSAVPWVFLGGHIGMFLAGIAVLLGVLVSRALRWVRRLREGPVLPAGDDESFALAARPLTHAAVMAALTYVMVAEAERSGLAGVVILGAGGVAVLLPLIQARRLVRGQSEGAFSLPDVTEVAQRLATPLPPVWVGIPLLEIAFLVATLPGQPEPPWTVLAAGGLARLWRWFAT